MVTPRNNRDLNNEQNLKSTSSIFSKKSHSFYKKINFKTNMTKRKILKDYNDDKLSNFAIKKDLANKYVIAKPFNFIDPIEINPTNTSMKDTLMRKTAPTKINSPRTYLKGLV